MKLDPKSTNSNFIQLLSSDENKAWNHFKDGGSIEVTSRRIYANVANNFRSRRKRYVT